MTAIAKKRLRALLIIAAVVFLIAFYYWADPNTSRLMPPCLFHKLTGFDCPGCGSQRMVHALLNGDFRAAWGFNPFLISLTPVILLYLVLDMFPAKFPRLFKVMYSPVTITILLVSIVVWTILRNILA